MLFKLYMIYPSRVLMKIGTFIEKYWNNLQMSLKRLCSIKRYESYYILLQARAKLISHLFYFIDNFFLFLE